MNQEEERKSILLVSHEMTYTGAPQSLLGIAGVLLNNEFSVTVWTLVDGPFKKEFKDIGIYVKTINFPDEASESLANQLKSYDLIIANTIFCSEFAAYAKHFSKTVLYVREANNISQLVENCGLCESDIIDAPRIICVSEYSASALQEQYGISKKNIQIIHNFTDDLFSATENELSRDTSLTEKKIIHFMVSGTMEPRKGQKVAVEAYRALPEEYRQQSSLHFVGSQPQWSSYYWQSLMSSDDVVQVTSLEDSCGIFYHGNIQNRSELMELYNKMDVILIPSEDEACSLVALEASMLGKMILLSENTGAKYLVDPSCILKTGNIPAWTQMMQKCIEDPEWSRLNGRKNRNAYLEDATRDIYEHNLISYIESFLRNDEIEIRDVMPSVSIVVPIYNVETYLSECLDSLLSQTLSDIEIICVNDGSTDESPSILEKYEKENTAIKVFNIENHGYGYAMNYGCKKTLGEYIGIVEPDDYIDPRMYEVLYNEAIETFSDIVKADFYHFYGEKDCRDEIYFSTALDDSNYNRVIDPKNEKECFRFILNTWTGIYRRRFIDEYDIRHNETPGASYQDNGFWFQGFCQAKRIYFVREAFYHNRRDNPASSANNQDKVYAANEEYRLIRIFLQEHPDLEREFIGQYSMKKLHTYLFALQRIGWEYKKDYIQAISREFKEAELSGEIHKDALTASEWGTIQWIIRDPEDYYDQEILGKIKISLIIPAYNSIENHLEQCLQSIKAQQFKDFEVLCICDGSDDVSKDIISSFVIRDKRFKMVHQENMDDASDYNLGIDLAKGDYIIFLEADCYFAPEMLQLAYQALKRDNAQICFIGSCQNDDCTDKNEPCDYVLPAKCNPNFSPFNKAQINFSQFFAFFNGNYGKLYDKRYLLNQELRFQEQRYFNAMYFVFMSMWKADRITIIDNQVIYQRKIEQSFLPDDISERWACFYNALIAIRHETFAMGQDEKNDIFFKNFAIHNFLWNIANLPENVALQLIDNLSWEWISDLGIEDLSETDYVYKNEFQNLYLLREDSVIGLEKIRDMYQSEIQAQKSIIENEAKKQSSEEISDQFKKQAEYNAYCLDEIRKSKSYKIGLAITWLPRKIRGRKKEADKNGSEF